MNATCEKCLVEKDEKAFKKTSQGKCRPWCTECLTGDPDGKEFPVNATIVHAGKMKPRKFNFDEDDANPTPDDALDAARYRWLKANCLDNSVPSDGKFGFPDFAVLSFGWRRREWEDGKPYVAAEMDAAIDRARQTEEGKS